MSDLQERLARLSPEQRAHLEKRLLQKAGTGGAPTAIPRRFRRDEPAPLSFPQQRLWFLHQMDGENAHYNIPLVYRLQGRVDQGALERALRELVRRHEALRTRFVLQSGGPVQLVGEPTLDLQRLDCPDEGAALARAAELVRIPFDLEEGPPVRAALLQVAGGDSLLLLVAHHIAMDGWSAGVLLRELAALYTGRPLPDLPVQYRDFAAWQRESLQGPELQRQLDYWRKQLGGGSPVLELPADRPRPPVISHRGAKQSFTLGPDLTAGLKRLSRESGATLFITLLAGFQALLHRYSGQAQITVGTPIANRTRPELEGLVGYFANTLALRTDLGGSPTFRELLARVKEVALDAYANQDVPFERLVEELQPERSMSHQPFFQVLFALQNASGELPDLPEVKLQPLMVDAGTALFDLTLSLEERNAELYGVLQYSTDLFDPSTIKRLVGHFEHLLAAAAAEPDCRVADLPLLTEAERQQLLLDWNATDRPYDTSQAVFQAIEQHAARLPHAVAVTDGEERITYGELNRRANQLAHYLRGMGVGPESLVGICMERSGAMLVGLLGILKAGAAYVPLDPAYPPERLQFTLEDARAAVLLTQESLTGHLPGYQGPVLCLDSDWDGLVAAMPEQNPDLPVQGSDLAYVIYTSGSTGRPKGVMVEHRSLLNLVHWHQQTFGISAADRTTQVAGPAFDASVWEIWPCLAAGACLAIVDEERRTSPQRLRDWLVAQGITAAFLPTPLAEGVLALQWPASAALRVLLTGGDQLRSRPRPGMPFTLYNNYGPTESTVVATCCPVPPGEGLPPIGRPIANVSAYVLDAQLQPVPVGVPGELCLGGAGLARGYLNRPELTAERFVPSPLRPGERLYRTGDLVRYLPDGQLEFLGRIDQQVKIRGFRIELGEIESVLGGHPGVRETVVIAREDLPGEKQLVAYVVAGPDGAAAEELRSFLQERLPAYMVPAAFVTLPALPLTPNGKVDRQALPAPEESPGPEGAAAPRTPAESLLAAIFGELLNRHSVPRDASFFALGGHSLLATRLLARIQEQFGVELPLRLVFEASSVAALAEALGRAAAERVEQEPIRRRAGQGTAPLSYAQERLWFLSQMEEESPLYHVPAVLDLRGPLDADALQRALLALGDRHEALRTTFVMKDGDPVQLIADSLPVPLVQADLRSIPADQREAEAERRAARSLRQPFDLARGPLWRALLLRLDQERHWLVLTLHHLIADGWSLGVLWRELGDLYRGAAPAPLPLQYADYAVWQRQWLEGPVLDRDLAYWRRQLGTQLQPLQLPTDFPRPPVQSGRGAKYSALLPAPLTERLQAICQREGVTLYMFLLAAFQTLLHRYSGQAEIAVGTPVAGRTRQELEGLVGLFVNTLVMRADLSGAPDFRALLAQVRESCIGAFQHQHLPFEKLVEELHPERDLSRSPLFQAMFVLQNAADLTPDLAGLAVKPVTVSGGVSLFDLTLSVEEREEGLAAIWQYSTDLFTPQTVSRMAGHFRVLLEAAAEDPARPVSALPLLTEAERQQILVDWNATERPYDTDRPLFRAFEGQAARQPEAVALVWGEERITYGELNRRANQLAHYLRGLGVGSETLVGICLERTPAMLVGLLGILKAGGAYVPLDPAYPRERLAFILEDAEAPVLITQASLGELLPGYQGALIRLDSDWEPLLSAMPVQNPDVPIRGSQLGYVIYTSGSTGRPKGVPIEHGSAVTLLCWAEETFRPEERAAVLAATSICFDLSVFELFLPLSAGDRIILAENALALPELPAAGEVTLINTVPSAAAELVRMGGIPASVVTVNLAGEPLPRWLAQQLYRLPHVERVYNLYGPSEDTTYSTWALVERDSERPPHIGRPIANTQVYLLDGAGQPTPSGVPGELYIGGAGLARGYLKRPELTAERFVIDARGVRLYRTGDLARWLPDGNIDFLGRIDHQVKIRGFRIELGEIESVLSRHPGVRESVVIVREDQPGDRRIVAYVVTDGADPAALRDYLGERLPGYMVPAAFVTLQALPLTPNGKVDRKALPVPDSAAGSTTPESAPRTPLEQALSDLWSDLLGCGPVSREATFFDLGGHSLLATRLMARIKERFGVVVPLRAFFAAPTIAGLAEWLARGPVAASLMEEPDAPARAGGAGGGATIPRRHPEEPWPLSYVQQRLWFLSQLDPTSPFYNLTESYLLEGALETAALQGAINRLVGRHESLRTTFAAAGGEPVQQIALRLEVPLVEEDLTQLPPDQRMEAALGRLAEAGRAPFDLAGGPLVRFRLLRLGDRQQILQVEMHHIISDGWSLGVLFRELSEAYSASVQGREPALAPLPIQYADFACWQRSHLRGAALEAQLAWWRRALGNGKVPALELPTDRPRPAVQTYRGVDHRFHIGPELTDGLRQLARAEGATLFMVLLTGWFALLHRHSGQEQLNVGSPIANRLYPELEGLVGCFANTLVLRGDLSGNPSFRELLRRVKAFALGAYDHQDLPFEKLVQELQPERDLSRSPLFQAFFALQNMELAPPEMAGLTARRLTPSMGTAKFDLSLALTEQPGGLNGLLQCAADLFDPATAERLAGRLTALLASAVQDPDRPAGDLELLTAAEREEILVTYNRTEAPYPQEQTVFRLFERQAEATPDAVAATCGEQVLTYDQLNRRANRLAHHLRGQGVGPESLVGISMERGLDLLVGLLAIWKAGGAYVPLDPTYPQERLAFMTADAGLAICVTEAVMAALDPTLPETNLPGGAGPANLAYVIYTSGSTGKPKGVQVEHRNLTNFLTAMQREPGLTAADRLLSVTSVSFDIAGLELYLPLITGARVVIATREEVAEGDALARRMERSGATLMQATPATYRLLLAAGWQNPTRIRLLIGGEALPRELAAALLQTGAELWNLYGPTETTIWSTACWVVDAGRAITIGRPIANTQIYIVDRQRRPVPVGVPGELYIGGDGVARGYLNREELTAERFVTDARGARLYRTGDLARWLPSGEIDFLGRIDHQVKIRGYRIELGEIEAVLTQHPQVGQAVVTAREDSPGEKRLVAYLVAAGEAEAPGADALRAFLGAQLPAYMIPSAFVTLPALPLTPNGKVDRQALPAPDTARPALAAAFVAPGAGPERQIAAIWQEVLRVEQVGLEDNFFDLGGHSLLLVQVHARLREQLGADLTLMELFQYPTVGALARRLTGAGQQEARLGRGRERVADERREAMMRQRQARQESRLAQGQLVKEERE